MNLLSIAGVFAPFILGYLLYISLIGKKSLIDEITFSFGLGYGIINVLLFVGNQFLDIEFNFINSLLLLISLYIIIAILGYHNRDILIENIQLKYVRISKLRGAHFENHEYIWLLIIIILILVFYKAVFFPIHTSDAISYHAVLPREIYHTGWMSHDVGPAFVEFTHAYHEQAFLSSAWLSHLNGEWDDTFVKIIPPICGILIILLTYNIGFRLSGKKNVAILAVCMSLSSQYLFRLSIILNSDIITSFYSVFCLYLLLKYSYVKQRKFLTLAGIMGGLSVYFKYSGILFLFSIISSLMIWELFHNLKYARSLKNLKQLFSSSNITNLFHFMIPLILIPLPYYLRNWIYFGNPVYPRLSSVFGGDHLDTTVWEYSPDGRDYSTELYQLSLNIFSNNFSIPFLIIILFVLRFRDFRKWSSVEKFFPLFIAVYSITWLLLPPQDFRPFIPLVPFISAFSSKKLLEIMNENDKKNSFLMLVLTISVLMYVMMDAINTFSLRAIKNLAVDYLWVGISLIISLGLCVSFLPFRILQSLRLKKYLKIGIVLLILVIPISSAIYFRYHMIDNKSPFIHGPPSDEDVLDEYLDDVYRAHMWINDHLNSTDIILSLTPYSYYLDIEIISAGSYKLEPTYTSSNLSDAINVIRNLGITHVWDSDHDADYFEELHENSLIYQNLNDTKYFNLIHEESGKQNIRIFEVIY